MIAYRSARYYPLGFGKPLTFRIYVDPLNASLDDAADFDGRVRAVAGGGERRGGKEVGPYIER